MITKWSGRGVLKRADEFAQRPAHAQFTDFGNGRVWMAVTDETVGQRVEWFGSFTPGNRVHLWAPELGPLPVTALGPAVQHPSGNLDVALAIGGPGMVSVTAKFGLQFQTSTFFLNC
jgi:hypothetical protein